MDTAQNIKVIKLEYIDEPAEAMRSGIDMDSIELLAVSIRADGLINPITVRPVGERYQVVAGHRRLLACRIAPLYDVPCVIRELDDAQVFNIMSAENLAREDVNPVDQAIHIGRLVGEDESKIPEVAHRLHYSEQWVRSRLEILSYPENFLPYVADGTLKLGVAANLAAIESEFWRDQYLMQAVKHGMSVVQSRYLHDQVLMGLCPEPDALLPDAENYNGGRSRIASATCVICKQVAVEPNLELNYCHRECPEPGLELRPLVDGVAVTD